MSGFDIGEPDLWDEVDVAVDRIQEPPVVSLSPLRDTGDVSVNPDSRTLLNADSNPGVTNA